MRIVSRENFELACRTARMSPQDLRKFAPSALFGGLKWLTERMKECDQGYLHMPVSLNRQKEAHASYMLWLSQARRKLLAEQARRLREPQVQPRWYQKVFDAVVRWWATTSRRPLGRSPRGGRR